jgi:two-component system osmolarity sensor histidine kinase EnvZ
VKVGPMGGSIGLGGMKSDVPSDARGLMREDLSPVAALAHDLRSPISAVLGFARLAREDLDAGDLGRAKAFLERIERSAAVIDAVLEAALAGDSRETAVPADLDLALEQIRSERKGDLERGRIRVIAQSDAPGFAVRQADLYRLLSNLVGNAIDHMGTAVNATIAVSVQCDGERATLRVCDNGAGIAPERSERVFEVAHTFRAGGTQRSHRGFGLAIVRELAASWGGCAWVEPRRARGATLCVTIPVAR